MPYVFVLIHHPATEEDAAPGHTTLTEETTI